MKKKDGSWHFYVNYKASKQVSIKDEFPISSIGELRAIAIFSKLDLRSSYIYPSDIEKIVVQTHEGHYVMLYEPF